MSLEKWDLKYDSSPVSSELLCYIPSRKQKTIKKEHFKWVN